MTAFITSVCDHCELPFEHGAFIYDVSWCASCWHSDIGKAALVKAGISKSSLCGEKNCTLWNGWSGDEAVKVQSIPKKKLLCPQCGEQHL